MEPPVVTDGADEGPEQLVTGVKGRALPGGAGQDRELLAQQEVLRHQVVAVADDRAEHGHEEEQVLKHHPDLMRPGGPQRSGPRFSPLQVPGSLADLLITFTLSGYHDPELRAAIDAVKPRTTAVTASVSARQTFPDAFYDFSRTGRMVWQVPREMVAQEEVLDDEVAAVAQRGAPHLDEEDEWFTHAERMPDLLPTSQPARTSAALQRNQIRGRPGGDDLVGSFFAVRWVPMPT